jgi:allantoinase
MSTLKAIRSSRIVTPEAIRDGFLIIRDGIIDSIENQLPEGDFELFDVGNKVVMPGIIDPHVHINEPGRTDWEGFDHATRAAIAGGITSMIEMPLNASPVTTTVAAFEEKIHSSFGKLHANCGFWGGSIPGNGKEIEGLIAKGVKGFKAFLSPSGIDEFPNVTRKELQQIMFMLGLYGLPLLVHCEIEGDAPPVTDARSYQQYLASRPQSWENEAINLMIELCERSNCRTHIVHLSSASALDSIRVAKEKGIPLTVETAPHYLFFNAEKIPDGRTEYKCAPPIRESTNNEKLWDALKEGLIDFVATDHSPATPSLKQLDSGNLTDAWGGINSLQFSLSATWTGAEKRGVDISTMNKWLSEKPAMLAGLENSKGKLAAGYDADLVVWDPEAEYTATAEMMMSRHKISPYIGETLKGKVFETWLGGEKVFENGDLVLPGQGSLLIQ